MAGDKGAGYWRARAEALEELNRRLHERLYALAAILPPEYLDDLEFGAPAGQARRAVPPVMNPGEDGAYLTPANVEPEIRGLWARTAPPERD
jgi:hypothetical protein